MYSRSILAACIAAASGSWIAAPSAQAAPLVEPTVGLDLDFAVPVQSPLLTAGAGFDARVGVAFHIASFSLTPELALGYVVMDARVFRFHPGVRFGVGRLIMASVYGHIGYGLTRYLSGATTGWEGTPIPASVETVGGASFDAGAALDIRPIRRVSVGAQAGYNVTQVGRPGVADAPYFAARWLNFGLHGAVYF